MKTHISVALTVVVLTGGFVPAALADAAALRAANAARTAAQAPIADDPQLPRVLLIGDSIAMGYTLPLRELLKGKANVHYPYENCHTSEQILGKLDSYLGDKPWDVIQFNCGIHDLTRTNAAGKTITNGEPGVVKVPLDLYRKNLGEIVTRLRRTGAELIWCSSTPMTNNLAYRRADDIKRYNAVAKEVMESHGITITDLYAAATRNGPPKWVDYGHFTVEGTREQAREILPAIEAALAKRPARAAAKLAAATTAPPGVAFADGASMKAARKAAANRQRRFIVNSDGGEPVRQMTRPSAQDLLDLDTAKLVGTRVDSLFYCTGPAGMGVFHHLTKIGQPFTSREGSYSNNQMAALLEKGIDPLRVTVQFAKSNGLEVFWSMRMNDTHDGSKAEYGPIRFRFNKLKMEHPEYLIGTAAKPPKHGAWTAVNCAVPEIRELVFRYLEDVCRGYEVDGVEMDFFRHPVFFKSTGKGLPATAAERAAMTELMKRIRVMADEVGRARGRPILIAMRVPDSAEYCRAIGLEIDDWMANDLLDILAVSSYFKLNDWDYSVALARRYGVKIYPSLDESRVRDATAQSLRRSALAYRGRAANIWAYGADGIYAFNFSGSADLLRRELGDPQVLAKLDKDYFGSVRGVMNAAGGNLPYGKYQTIETLNPGNPKVVAPGKTAEARIIVGEDWNQTGPVNLKLRLQFKTALKPQSLQVSCNDQPLRFLGDKETWLEYEVTPSAVRRLANQIQVKLAASAPQAIWTDLMLEVRHPPASKKP